MIELAKITDKYSRVARVYPALLLVAPVFMVVSFVYPEMYSSAMGIVAVLAGLGGVNVLAAISRDAGKRRESEMFEEWGGVPSIAILRHRDSRLGSVIKHVYHEKLSTLTGVMAPSDSDERANPELADECYEAWSNYLRTNSRDTSKYSLLFTENINYGFRRNVYGLKPWFITSSILGLLILLVSKYDVITTDPISQSFVVFCTAYLIFFAFFVNASWVKIVADEYAKRLVESVDS